MFGTTAFTAVINPPQACILAIGAGIPRVVPSATGDKLRVVNVMTVQLSADRRVVSEALASEFLQVCSVVLRCIMLMRLC
jgi:pyruvate dehydrogenase E2 component (dihydrolipoamide acetyltransferase)